MGVVRSVVVEGGLAGTEDAVVVAEAMAEGEVEGEVVVVVVVVFVVVVGLGLAKYCVSSGSGTASGETLVICWAGHTHPA